MVNDVRACHFAPGGTLSPEKRSLYHFRARCPHKVKLDPHEMLIETTNWTERTPPPSNSHILLSQFFYFDVMWLVTFLTLTYQDNRERCFGGSLLKTNETACN